MVFTTNVTPQTQLNVRSSAQQVAPDTLEVTLTITVEAKDKDSTLFLAEVAQSGIFVIQGYTAEEQSILIGSFCPNTLLSVRARSDLRSRHEGRIPAAAAAAAELRRDLRAGAAGAQRHAPNAAGQAAPAASGRGDALARRVASRSSGPGRGARRSRCSSRARGHPAALWARDRAHAAAMQRDRRNARYLPDTQFPDTARGHGGSRRGRRARPTTSSSPCRATRCASTLTALAALPLRRLGVGNQRASSSIPGCCRIRSRGSCCRPACRRPCCRGRRSRARSARGCRRR